MALGEEELKHCTTGLERLKETLNTLKNKEEALKQEERSISISIEKDEVGSKIKDLDKEIRNLQNHKDSRSRKSDEYNKIAQTISLEINPDEETFYDNREKAKQLKQATQQNIDIENENLRLLKNKEDQLKQDIEELVTTVRTLQENKNNIAGRVAEIRDEILDHIGASKEEIPFIGELIKVKEEEKDWEASIEKLLHNFALRLIVPKKYYSAVNDYVNNTNLRGRIRYDKYEHQETLKHFAHKIHDDKALIHKIEIKPKTQYADWIEDYLETQFHFTCVENLVEFEKYSEMALTKNGLIKFKRGKHEKDDRPHINRKDNYVLGWDNTEKINALKKELKQLQTQQTENKKSISDKNTTIKNLSIRREECHNLFSKFEKYDDINWQTYATEIQEKIKQKEVLEKTNNRVKQLQEDLKKIQNELKINEEDITNQNRKIFQIEAKQKDIENTIAENRTLYNSLGEKNISEFEEQNPDLLNIAYSNFASIREHFKNKNAEKIRKCEDEKRKKEDEVRIKINAFEQPEEDILNKFKDWRADVNTLPDSIHLELISEYQEFLKNLETDNLPKFEKKFNEYLQETLTNKIGDFRMFFENWMDNIKENIRHLNESLKEIDFKNNPKTYIQLVAANKISDEVKEFRNLLSEAIPNINQTQNLENRRHHFDQHIQPFIEKLNKEEWRRKVMDVRSWFNYKAEEFYRETNHKFKTYEAMGQLSGGEKAQLTYTILGSAIAYQFGLTNNQQGLESKSFRFIAIDEAFKAQDEDKARYLITLCKQLHLQLLVVTPSDNIHIVEKDISFVHFVERRDAKYSWLWDMPIEQFNEEKSKYLNQ